MKFIVAMLITLFGMFLVGMIFAIPEATTYGFTRWEYTYTVLAGVVMGLVGFALVGFGVWLGNRKEDL